jgi:hypothetical protein
MAIASNSEAPNLQFPDPGFVQVAVENHLGEFERDTASSVDLAWFNPESGVRWVVEVKGGAGPARPKFQSGLGALLSCMEMGRRTNYCLAMPGTDDFAFLCHEFPAQVQRDLNLWWFLAGRDGVIDVIPPFDLVRLPAP